MASLFERAYSFDQPLDKWDVSHVVKFDYTFSSTPFNQDISSWNISAEDQDEVSMEGMFMNATKFNGPLDSWNVDAVYITDYMFANAVSFDRSLNSWRLGYLFKANSMFQNATKFNQPIADWFNELTPVEEMSSMFLGASSFQQDLCPWYYVTFCSYQYYSDCTYPVVTSMFNDTDCPVKADPDFTSQNFFCKTCIKPSRKPSKKPSKKPSEKPSKY